MALEIFLRDALIERLLKIPGAKLNGHSTRRLPNNVNITFPHVNGADLLLMAEMRGSSRLTLSDETTDDEIQLACEILNCAVASLEEF